MTYIEYIHPTGLDQTSEFEEAISDLESSDGNSNTILLKGEYLLSSGLTTGSTLKEAVSFRGIASATLRYVGAEDTTDYLLTFDESHNWQAPRVSELQIDCGQAAQCRGILFRHQRYQHLWDKVMILRARQVAVDAIACYGSRGDSLMVGLSNGIALRCATCNDCTINKTRVWYHYGSTWPATDDTTVLNYNDTPVQTPTDERGAVVVGWNSQGLVFNAINFEQHQSTMGPYPLMHVAFAHHVNIHNWYDENCKNSQCKIIYRGLNTDLSRCVNLWINNPWSIHYAAGTQCKTFLQLEGRTAGTRITDCQLYGHQDGTSGFEHIAMANSGLHEKTVIEGAVLTKYNADLEAAITQANWWGTDNDGAWRKYRSIGPRSVTDEDLVSTGMRRDESLVIPDLDAYYIGDPSTDGSWRISRVGDALAFERRISGEWVVKSSVEA